MDKKKVFSRDAIPKLFIFFRKALLILREKLKLLKKIQVKLILIRTDKSGSINFGFK